MSRTTLLRHHRSVFVEEMVFPLAQTRTPWHLGWGRPFLCKSKNAACSLPWLYEVSYFSSRIERKIWAIMNVHGRHAASLRETTHSKSYISSASPLILVFTVNPPVLGPPTIPSPAALSWPLHDSQWPSYRLDVRTIFPSKHHKPDTCPSDQSLCEHAQSPQRSPT